MKGFIRDTIIISIIGIIIILGIDLWTRLVPTDNIYSFKSNYMESHAKDIKILLLGNSLFEGSFNNHILGDSTFNLAMCGRASAYDVLLLEKYIDKMPHLETVLFPILYSLDNPTGYYNDKKTTSVYIYHYYKYMKILPNDNWYLYYIPKLTFNWEKKNSGEFVKSVDSTGYAKTPCLKFLNSGIWDGLLSQEHSNEYCSNLCRMAKLCNDKNIRFIAVTPPTTDLFLSYTTPSGIKKLDSIIDEVRDKYPIEYHNYISDSAFRSHDYYYNNTHLNHCGATFFAKRVKEDFGL